MASSTGNIRIEPVDVQWEIEEQSLVKCQADVAGSLAAKYITFGHPTAGEFYAWFDDGIDDVDPAPGGTGIAVSYTEGDSAAVIAAALQAAVDGHPSFVATVSGDEVLIEPDVVGEATPVADGDTAFTVTRCQEGGAIYLGLLDGDVEVSFEEQTFEVTAHQTGTSLRADLRQGVSAEVTLTMKETDLDKMKEMFSKSAGGVFTPGAGTELFGWGDSRQGQNTVIQARRLIFHPVALATSDRTRDLCFWKAYPMPDSLTYSGENPNVLSMTFKTYLDSAKPAGINLFAFGDHTQDGITA